MQLTKKSVNSENNNRHAGHMHSIRTNATHLITRFEELCELSTSNVKFVTANQVRRFCSKIYICIHIAHKSLARVQLRH